jgi:hypothetical protein
MTMKYYQEHLRGTRSILFTDYKPIKTLVTLYMQTMNRLQLAMMMDINFKIRKKGFRNASRLLVIRFQQN